MGRSRPAGLADSYRRFILWVDTSAMETAQVDQMVTDLLRCTEDYAPAAHIEVPLGLVD